MSSGAGKDEKFQLTSEELERLQSALKQEEFRKLFVDYAKEISDPENRRRYEEEISQLERDRGQDVKFIHPNPGFVMKAKLQDSKKKVFVNVCSNELVKAPQATPVLSGAKVGQNWSIPYSLLQGREDMDKSGVKCTVYDVVFSPESFKECEKDARFRQLLISTALEGLETQLDVKVDKKCLKFPNLTYKGTPTSSIVRQPHPEGPLPPDQQPQLPFPYPGQPKQPAGSQPKSSKAQKSKPEHEPVYTVTHRGMVDMGDFTNSRMSSAVKRPGSLLVKVELPGVGSVDLVDLEVFDRCLELRVEEPKYILDLPLHYDVDQEKTSARFDTGREVLAVSIPVLPPSCPPPTEQELLAAGGATEENIKPESTSTEDLPSTEGVPSTEDLPSTEGVPSTEDLQLSSSSSSIPTARSETRSPTSLPHPDGERNQLPKETVSAQTKHDGPAPPPTPPPSSLPLLPSARWCSPPYRFRHSAERLVFVLDVKSAIPGSVIKHFDQEWSHVTFSTCPGGQMYSFHIGTSDDERLDPGKCSVDVSSDNVVVSLVKDDNFQSIWSYVWIGSSSPDKKKLYFPTRSNAEQGHLGLDGLTEGHDEWLSGADHEVVTLEVDQSGDSGFTLDISRGSAKVEREGCSTLVQGGDATANISSTAENVKETAIQERQPNIVLEQPVVVQEQPTPVQEKPTVVQEQPVVVQEQPTVVQEQPVVVQEQVPEQPTVVPERPIVKQDNEIGDQQPPLSLNNTYLYDLD